MFRSLLAATLCLLTLQAQASPLKVITSFSILGDLVKQVGGDDVQVTAMVGPNQDAHGYEPRPADAEALAASDIVFVNGLGLDPWLTRLASASGYKGPVVTVTGKVVPLKGEEEGGTDPHAWQSVPNAELYAQAIEAGLEAADPAHASAYHVREQAYEAQLKALDRDVAAAFAPIPQAQRVVITTHDAFGYYGHAYGIEFLAPEGISTEAEPDAAAIAALIRQIKAIHVHAVFIENMSDPRLLKQISAEAGVDVSGTLYSDALSPAGGPASTYIDMLRYNTRVLASAMKNGN